MQKFSNVTFSVQKFFQAPGSRPKGDIDASNESNKRTIEKTKNLEAEKNRLAKEIQEKNQKNKITEKKIFDFDKDLHAKNFDISDKEEELPSMRQQEERLSQEVSATTQSLSQKVSIVRSETRVVQQLKEQYLAIKKNNPDDALEAHAKWKKASQLLMSKVADMNRESTLLEAKKRALVDASNVRQKTERELEEDYQKKEHFEEMLRTLGMQYAMTKRSIMDLEDQK